jgi:hypothetical protein
VTLTDQTTDPGLVRARQRCQVYPPAYWPGFHGGDGPLHRIRARLVAELGLLCAICAARRGGRPDHFAGIVSGLLCGDCNSRVDRCPHPDGCPFAAYLTDPPAGR